MVYGRDISEIIKETRVAGQREPEEVRTGYKKEY